MLLDPQDGDAVAEAVRSAADHAARGHVDDVEEDPGLVGLHQHQLLEARQQGHGHAAELRRRFEPEEGLRDLLARRSRDVEARGPGELADDLRPLPLPDEEGAALAGRFFRRDGFLHPDERVEDVPRLRELALAPQLAHLHGAIEAVAQPPGLGEEPIERDASALVQVLAADGLEDLQRPHQVVPQRGGVRVEGDHPLLEALRRHQPMLQGDVLLRQVGGSYGHGDCLHQGPLGAQQVERALRVVVEDRQGAPERHRRLRRVPGLRTRAEDADLLEEPELLQLDALLYVTAPLGVEREVPRQAAQEVPFAEHADDVLGPRLLLPVACGGLGALQILRCPGGVVPVDAERDGPPQEGERALGLALIERRASVVRESARQLAAATLLARAGDGVGDGALRPPRRQGRRRRLGLVEAPLVEEALRCRLERGALLGAALAHGRGEGVQLRVGGRAALDLGHVTRCLLDVAPREPPSGQGHEDLRGRVALLGPDETDGAVALIAPRRRERQVEPHVPLLQRLGIEALFDRERILVEAQVLHQQGEQERRRLPAAPLDRGHEALPGGVEVVRVQRGAPARKEVARGELVERHTRRRLARSRRLHRRHRGRGARRAVVEIEPHLYPGASVVVQRSDDGVARIGPGAPVAEAHHAGLVARLDLDLVGEPPHEEALEAALLRIAAGALPGWEVVTGGVHVVDERQDLSCRGASPAFEDVVGVEAAVRALLFGHGLGKA